MKNIKTMVAAVLFVASGIGYNNIQKPNEDYSNKIVSSANYSLNEQTPKENVSIEAPVENTPTEDISKPIETPVQTPVEAPIEESTDTLDQTQQPPVEMPPVEEPQPLPPVVQQEAPLPYENAKVIKAENVTIGNIKLNDDYEKAFNMYKQYYKEAAGKPNENYFNDGKGENDYGNFLISFTTDSNNKIIGIAYSNFNDVKDIPQISIGNVNINSKEKDILDQYGKPSIVSSQYTTKTLTYEFTYDENPIQLIFYIDLPSKKVFGYDLSFI